jgi:hypothetical protein
LTWGIKNTREVFAIGEERGMVLYLVNTTTVKPLLAPVGILYLTGYLRANGIDPHVIDFNMLDGIDDFKQKYSHLPAPDLIGFSIRNIDSTQWKLGRYFIPETVELVKSFSELYPGIPRVIGGPGFSIEPLEIMRRTGVEYGVVGEGETPLLELVRCIESGSDPRYIPGLIYKSDGDYRLNPTEAQSEEFLGNLPFQAIDAIEYDQYFKVGGQASVQTKRGCAMRCNYCTYPVVEGRTFRLVPPKRVVDEIEFLVDNGFDYFYLTDSVFNLPKHHAINVCKELISRKLDVAWHTYSSPLRFDDTIAELFREAGCDGVLFGADSCSDRMLEMYGKAFRKKDIITGAEACKRAGLEFSYHILFGPPGENLETARETLDLLDQIEPTAAFLTQGIRVYRNTPIFKQLVGMGRLDPDEPLLEPYFYFSEELPDNFSDVVREYALAREFCFSDVTVKSPSTNPEVERLYKENIKGPCWKVLKELRKLSEREEAEAAAIGA